MKFRDSKRLKTITGFNEIFTSIIHTYKLENSFTIQELSDQWSEIVGDIISTHSKPVRVYNQCLYISVDHPIFANELMIAKGIILEKIKDQYILLNIVTIKIEVMKIIW